MCPAWLAEPYQRTGPYPRAYRQATTAEGPRAESEVSMSFAGPADLLGDGFDEVAASLPAPQRRALHVRAARRPRLGRQGRLGAGAPRRGSARRDGLTLTEVAGRPSWPPRATPTSRSPRHCSARPRPLRGTCRASTPRSGCVPAPSSPAASPPTAPTADASRPTPRHPRPRPTHTPTPAGATRSMPRRAGAAPQPGCRLGTSQNRQAVARGMPGQAPAES